GTQRQRDDIVARSSIDDDLILRAIRGVRSTCQIDVDLRDIGAGEIVDGDLVGPAQGGEVDVLDIVQVHRDAGDVAGKEGPLAVGGDVDFLGDVGPVELHGVQAVLAFDRVAAIARVPDEGVIPRAQLRGVVAAPAIDGVVAIAAEQQVGPVATGDGVVAGTAVDGELNQGREAIAGGDDVIATVGVEHQVLGGADVQTEGRWCYAVEAHPLPVGGDGEGLGAVATVDLGGVLAGPAFHQVGPFARIPDHAVVAGLAEHLVVADAAGERVIARPAEQQVGPALAQQDVVAAAPEELVGARTSGQDVVARTAE